ncbi:hypothetical protein CTAYLR_008838 [Chrysophaeum taylorii]|uniref:Uncharacterized protein n=1 Tax=Chrysophaeum taylorii TaxID=2483200 RepID=A0AAD7U965_9STRA|nr:hypothetical protein CTAYLR_008838 [Chrysophaeum taylorii]
MEQQGAKRRRVKPEKYSSEQSVSNREEELYQQAIANSRQEKSLPKLPIPEAPTFRPTKQEFERPLEFIEKIRPEAEKFGICCIVPPPEFAHECCVDFSNEKKFSTKLQRIERLQESVPYEEGRKYALMDYKAMADNFLDAWVKDHDAENMETEYWRLVDGCAEPCTVEYGNDVDTEEYGSGFPCKDKTNPWNLNVLPKTSLLRHFEISMKGINAPWLYLGMLFSTFSWHTEDNFLASINYLHMGAPKQWYGVPGSHATAFENVVRRFYKQRLMEVPDLLHNLNTMFSPSKLKALQVPVFRLVQKPGMFVVTYPQAFHSGFSYGFNCGEAVNFATSNWIRFASLAAERYRRIGRLAVFSHDRLIFTLAKQIDTFSDNHAECLLLQQELEKICKEELTLRPRLYESGVRDVSGLIAPPKNTDKIDNAASDYDDKRVCVVCRHTCFCSAVACNCSQTQVVCLRHAAYLCKCPAQNKYLIEWESNENLEKLLKKVDDAIHAKFTSVLNPLRKPNLSSASDQEQKEPQATTPTT